MEAKCRIKWRGFGKMVIPLFLGLFLTARAEAQILGLGAPNITVQPMGTNVQNGDTVILNASAYCTMGNMYNVTWIFVSGRGGNIPTNAIVTTVGLGTTTASSTLTLNHISSTCAGTYYVDEIWFSVKVLLTVVVPRPTVVTIA